MKIKRIPVTECVTNCYIVTSENSNASIIIDPGELSERIIKHITENNLEVKYIFLTHGHFDHVGGATEACKKYNAPIVVSETEFKNAKEINKEFNFPVDFSKWAECENILTVKENDIITVDEMSFKVIETPGHTKGGICFLCDNHLFSGDVLFANSIGRTDFAQGSFEDIEKSIKKLYKLDDETLVLPGHGLNTKIGREKENNPYVRG